MAEYLSPGVYIEELDIGVKSIESVSTNTTGFVGCASDASILNVPTFVLSWGDFVSKFGRYKKDCYLAPAGV